MRLHPALWTTIFCSFGAMAILPVLPAQAQSANDLQTSSPQQPLGIFNQDDPNDPSNLFTDRANGSSVLNLINRIQLLNGKSPEQHSEDLNENLTDAAADFRKQQQEQLQQPPTFTDASAE